MPVDEDRKTPVFPASQRLFAMETWGKDAIPSTSQASGISYRSDSEPCLSTVMLPSDLPGSAINLFDELKAHPSCIIKSITIDNQSIGSPEKQGESWFSKIGIYTSKLTSLNCWKGMKEETRQLDRDIQNFTNSCLNESHELSECQTNEGQAYIPYDLAKMYISKIADDMQKMKLKYMDIIKEIDSNTKKQQEQISLSLRNHYQDKMRTLKIRIQAYHEVMDEKSQHFQDKMKDLEMEKEQWLQEKTSLLLEINELKEKLESEKCRTADMKKMEFELVKCPLCNGDYQRQIANTRSEKADEREQISYIL
ncbi:unconventional myosin-XVIIIa-like isoform X1 [Eleutherodactylus coqui]|uniref:unconventional myosin-XVIIIa-like isoform X1 n=1 Tax=Eleutherodactylus coqui TaxID=57060 RepID=UPI0034633E9A